MSDKPLVVEATVQVVAFGVIEYERLEEVHRTMWPLLHGQVPTKTKRVTTKGKGFDKDGNPNKDTTTVVAIPNDPIAVARLQLMAVQRILAASARRSALYGLDARRGQ